MGDKPLMLEDFLAVFPRIDAGLAGSVVLTGFLAAFLGGVKLLFVAGITRNPDESND